MPNVKRFTSPLSDVDLLDFEIRVAKGHVTDFTINYRARLGDDWHEVVRYDCAHGYLHIHRFWLPAKERLKALEDPKSPKPPYDQALSLAEHDLTMNWRAYRANLEASKHESHR